jgi:hypothetical protein
VVHEQGEELSFFAEAHLQVVKASEENLELREKDKLHQKHRSFNILMWWKLKEELKLSQPPKRLKLSTSA